MDEITDDWEIAGLSDEPLAECVQYDFEPYFLPSTTFMRAATNSAQILNLAAVEGGTRMTPAQLTKLAHEYRAHVSKPWNELTFMPESPYSEEGIIWLNEVVRVYGRV